MPPSTTTTSSATPQMSRTAFRRSGQDVRSPAGPALAVVEEDPGVEAEVDAGTALVKKQPTPKRKGQMNVISTHDGEPYWAQVSIDGVMRGRTPLLLDLPVGKYRVRVERTGFRPTMREVKIAGGKSVVVKVELVQR